MRLRPLPRARDARRERSIRFRRRERWRDGRKSSDTRVFAAKDLWQYIDGDAEQYIAAGVVSTSTSDYKYQGQLEAVVDVYTMGDSAGRKKILEIGQSRGAQRRCSWATLAWRTSRA